MLQISDFTHLLDSVALTLELGVHLTVRFVAVEALYALTSLLRHTFTICYW